MEAYEKDRAAISLLSRYEANDVAAIMFGRQSSSNWIISPPYLQKLEDDLIKNVTLNVQLEYIVSRKTNTEKIEGTVMAARSFILRSDSPARQKLIMMLTQTDPPKGRPLFPFLFLKFAMVNPFDALLIIFSASFFFT